MYMTDRMFKFNKYITVTIYECTGTHNNDFMYL